MRRTANAWIAFAVIPSKRERQRLDAAASWRLPCPSIVPGQEFFFHWLFLMENERRLAGNPRMLMPYRTLARVTLERREEIARQARQFLARLDPS